MTETWVFWLCVCEKQKIWFCFISLWAFLCHLFPFGSRFYSPPQLQWLGKMRIIHWSKKGQASCGSTHKNTSFHDSVFNLTEGKEQKMAPGIWKLQITRQNHSTSLSWKWLYGLKTMCYCCQFPSNSFYTVPCYLLVFCTKLHSRIGYLTLLCRIEEKLFHNIFMAVNTKLLWQSELICEQWIMWLHQQCVRLLYLLLLLAAAVNSAARPQPLSYGSL